MVRRTRHGFTLVELLIVIGILLLLLGIGTIGYMHIDKVAAEKATRTRLDTCSSILNEYESAGVGLSAVELSSGGVAWSPTAISPPWTTVFTPNNYGAPGDVNVGSGIRGGAPITSTGVVLYQMSHVPAVKTILSQLPASAILGISNPGSPIPPGAGPPPATLQVLLDGWKNPIIYVPSGGMSGVLLNQGTSNQVTRTVTAVDGRPFWASAGQDGNFGNGDDNVYSTAVVYH